MKTLLTLALLSAPAFAQGYDFPEGAYSRVKDLPTKQITCQIVTGGREKAQLQLKDGGNVNGEKFLRGDLVIFKNGNEASRLEGLDVLVNKDQTEIVAGGLGLDGLETAITVKFSIKENAMVTNPEFLAYTGAVAVDPSDSLSGFPRSNAACVFSQK